MAKNNHPDYLESLFEGINIILEKRLDDVSFDTTVICTITDASNSKNGEYRVTDGSTSYKAYSDLDSYVTGEQVRVSVPMGDFSQKKFIAGKYVIDNDSAPITYVSPLNNVVNMSGNLVPLGKTASITANGEKRSDIIWNQRMSADSYADLQANGIYNTIILKADFKTLLSNYDLIAGTYGLRLDLLVRPSVKSTGYIRRYVELNSREMFGNPYSFTIFSTQAKTFSISTIGIVEGIELSIFQNGDFKDRVRGPIIPNALTDDIFVNNIELGFGSDIINVDDNVVRIYSEDDMQYKYHNPTDSTNLKRIGLLWYNKDDHNKYLGFSDGLYAPAYDELEYLVLARMDTRLLAQKGREGIPTDKASLNLAANIEEAAPLIQKARDIINQDLTKALLDLRQQMIKIPALTDEINKLVISTGDKYLQTYSSAITNALSNDEKDKCGMVQQYANILDFARDTQEELDDDHHSKWNATLWEVPYYQTIVTNFQNVRDAILKADTGLLAKLGALVDGDEAEYGGYKGIYDVYAIRLQRILKTMDEYLGMAKDENNELLESNRNFPKTVLDGTDYTELLTYDTKTDFKTYTEQDLSAYANKYCIYWYRYEKDYQNTDVEALMPDGWRRLTFHDFYREMTLDAETYVANKYYTYNENKDVYELAKGAFSAAATYYELTTDDADFLNVGLSDKNLDENGEPILNAEGKQTHATKPAPGKGMFARFMQNDLEQERYVAVVFYNHEMYKSNELVFTNSEVIPDKTTLDKGDILIFEHYENSSDSFQTYNGLNYLTDAADEQKARRVRCHYDGLLAKDEAMVGAGIYWYVPINATMLTYDKEYLTNRGFKTDEGLLVENEDGTITDNRPYYSKDGYVCFYKKVEAQKMCSGCNKVSTECSCEEKTAELYWDYTNGNDYDNRDFWYKIKPRYEESASQNSIICQVRIEEDSDPVLGELLFTFGIAGTNGTKYTLDITNTSTQVAVTPSEGLNLDVSLRNQAGEKIPLSRSTAMTGIEVGDTYGCTADWLFHVVDKANEPSVQLKPLEGDEVTGLSISAGNYGIVELKASFRMPEGDPPEGDETSQKSRNVDLDCLQAIPYAADRYYISGPTTIVYNNYGTLDNTSMYDVPYKLYWGKDVPEKNIKAHQEVDVTWSIKYYIKEDGEFVELYDVDVVKGSETEKADQKKHNQYLLYRKYMPVINNGGGLTPSTLYLDNLECFAVVIATNSDGGILWEQPIIMVQNRYASTMLNSWDGGLNIDDENGTIMASMIGAGRKSDNNTFEGVLMGNIGLGTGGGVGFENAHTNPDSLDSDNLGYANQSGLGLYGFNNGAQSFGFNIDGSAFLGKAGSGRIIFNGNYGVIASANWFFGNPDLAEVYGMDQVGGIVSHNSETGITGITQTSTAGMCIDLEKGHIDAYDFKLTGSRIHFNSHPEDITNERVTGFFMRIGHDGKTVADPAELWLLEADVPEEFRLEKLLTPGYLAMDKDGNLTIRANSLYLTEQLGGENLLHQTAPKRTVMVPVKNADGTNKTDEDGNLIYHKADGTVDYDYDVSKWPRAGTVIVDGASDISLIDDTAKKDAVVKVNESDYTIYQDVPKPKLKEKYTVSGWICAQLSSKTDGSLLLEINNIDAEGKLVANLDAEGNPAEGGVAQAEHSLNEKTIEFNGSEWTYFEYTFRAAPGYDKMRVAFKSNCNFYLWHAKLEEGSIATTWHPSKDDIENNVENVKDQYDTYLAQDQIFNKLVKDPISGKTMVGIWMIPAEESASGRKELYINATYISTGILRSSNWDGKLSEPIAVLDENGKQLYDAYGRPLYTYNIIENPKAGVYFNLNEGKIWAAKFELTAGNTLYMNSHPGASQSYFRVGTDSYFLDFNSSGKLTLKVTNFDLIAGSGSNTIKITSNSESNPIDVGNGQFKVTWAGKLIAQNADIYGKVEATELIATSKGTIGGWQIDSTRLYYGTGVELNGSAGTMTFGGGGGAETSSYFHVSNAGKITATGAELTTLKVKTEAVFTNSCQTKIEGNLGINTEPEKAYDLVVKGKASFTGNIYMTDATRIYANRSTDTCIYFDSNQIYLAGSTTALAASTVRVGKNPDVNGPDSSTVYIGGTTHVYSDFHYHKTITCYNGGTPKPGKTGTFKTSNWFGGSLKLSFINGIMVGSSDDGTDIEDLESATLPSITGNAGACLTVNSTAENVEWKKFYAPTSQGTSGYVWMGNGTTSDPSWQSLTGFTTDATNRKYKINKDASNNFYVNVPWTDTTYEFKGSGATSVTKSGNTITISSTDTNTWPTSCYAKFAGVDASKYVCTRAAADYGSIYRCGFTGSSVTTSSALRFKNTINNLNNTDILFKLRPVSYYYNKDTGYGDNLRYGFIAEEVMEFAPELIEMDPEDNSLCNSIYYNSIISLAVAEIQKLRKELDELKSNFNI